MSTGLDSGATSLAADHEPKAAYTILQGDGLYPDSEVEDQIFAPLSGQVYQIKYLQAYLWPPGSEQPK